MPSFCLNMIVKNERANLERALKSVAGDVTCYAIYDTGSTDGTQAFIEDFFARRGIPGRIENGTFINFSQARNEGLRVAREQCEITPYDYMLLMDADMELVTGTVTAGQFPTGAPCFELIQEAGSLSYANARILDPRAQAEYVGVTHEYLSVPWSAPLTEWKFIDHATGSNRGDKAARDIRLLQQDLREHPTNGRTRFYLANTYKDVGRPMHALKLYEERILQGGWDEETWFCMLQAARCERDMGRREKFIIRMQEAYNYRPSRAEPLYDLATYFREKGQNALAWMYADLGSKLPLPTDKLFVDTNPHRWGFLQEKSITGFYEGRTRAEGFSACNQLCLSRGVPHHIREHAKDSIGHYLRPLSDFAPSWHTEPIKVDLPPGYTAMNPSVAWHNGFFALNVRAVNYKITENGSYDMQGDTAIRTKNFLVWYDRDLKPTGSVKELWDKLPDPKYPDVVGMEDVRIYTCAGELGLVTNMREQNYDAMCEQWVGVIDKATGEVVDTKLVEPNFEPTRLNQKNWMPVSDCGELKFMYRLGRVIDPQGKLVHDTKSKLDVDHMAGGGNVVRWEGGWVALVHEARMDPAHGYSKRYYQHRFVWMDHTFEVQRVSKPFVFEAKQIEFAAGFEKHHVNACFVVTYSANDATAMVATISDSDLRHVLWNA